MKAGMVILLCGLLAGNLFYACTSGKGPADPEGFNLILVSLDTLRADHLGCYGYNRPTSGNIDRVARKGVVFENAISSAPWTLPSHVSLFTSLYPPAHGVEMMDLAIPASEITLTERLRDSGYRTGGFCGSGLLRSEFGFAQGFEVYRDDLTGRIHRILPPAMDWLKVNRDRKFFLFLHCYDIHFPYAPADPRINSLLMDKYDRVPFEKIEPIIDRWNRGDALTKEEMDDLVFIYLKYYDRILEINRENRIREPKTLLKKVLQYVRGEWQTRRTYEKDLEMARDLYDGEIMSTDRKLGELFDFLEKHHLWDDTLVVITSDHGEGLMDHGVLEHSKTLYNEVLRIPLIMIFPGGSYAGRRVDPCVRNIDIMPTVLEFLGLERAQGEELQGTSLLPVIRGAQERHPAFSSTEHPVKKTSLIWKNYKLIINRKNKSEELYRLSSDPRERQNILSEAPEIREELLERLKGIKKNNQILKKHRSPEKVIFDDDMKKELEQLGYLN